MCIIENTEKHIDFSGELKKTGMKIDRKTKVQTNVDIKHQVKFINRFKFISSSLSNFTDNLFEELHGKCDNCTCRFEYKKVGDNLLSHKT